MVLVSLNNVIISQNNKKYVLILLNNVNYILEIVVLNNRVCYVVNNITTEITFENVISNNINIDIQCLTQQYDYMYQNTNVSLRQLTVISIVKNQQLIPEVLLPQMTNIIQNECFPNPNQYRFQ